MIRRFLAALVFGMSCAAFADLAVNDGKSLCLGTDSDYRFVFDGTLLKLVDPIGAALLKDRARRGSSWRTFFAERCAPTQPVDYRKWGEIGCNSVR